MFDNSKQPGAGNLKPYPLVFTVELGRISIDRNDIAFTNNTTLVKPQLKPLLIKVFQANRQRILRVIENVARGKEGVRLYVFYATAGAGNVVVYNIDIVDKNGLAVGRFVAEIDSITEELSFRSAED